MGVQVSLAGCVGGGDGASSPAGAGAGAARSRRRRSSVRPMSLVPFNYEGWQPAPGALLVNFSALPPAQYQYFRHNLPADAGSGGGVVWSIDVHFVPRSERDLIGCFGAFLHRPGLTPAPINAHLSGAVCQWRVKSRQEITCQVVRGVQPMTYPCRIAVQTGQPLICFAGPYGLTTAGLHSEERRHGGRFSIGEVVKSVAMSPNDKLLLALIRIAHGFHLRIVRHDSVFAVEEEVRLNGLIPGLRLTRSYTETGHCAWSWDSGRVGFAASTGHYGVLLRRRRRGRRQEAADELGCGDGSLQLEWLHTPPAAPAAAHASAASASSTSAALCDSSSAASVALSAPRAFAFWPANPADYLDDDDAPDDCCHCCCCCCLLAVGGVGGFVDLVGGFVPPEDHYDERPAEYRRLLRLRLPPPGFDTDADTNTLDHELLADNAEVLQFSGSGRLLAVGCLSGRVLVYDFCRLLRSCRRRRRRRRDASSELPVQPAQLVLTPETGGNGDVEGDQGGGGTNSAAVTSLDFADSEEVLAAGDTHGRVRLWRLGAAADDSEEPAAAAALSSLALLCRRAVAARCPVGLAARLPLPAALLPSVCVNRRDRQHLLDTAAAAAARSGSECKKSAGGSVLFDDLFDGVASSGRFSISFV